MHNAKQFIMQCCSMDIQTSVRIWSDHFCLASCKNDGTEMIGSFFGGGLHKIPLLPFKLLDRCAAFDVTNYRNLPHS